MKTICMKSSNSNWGKITFCLDKKNKYILISSSFDYLTVCFLSLHLHKIPDISRKGNGGQGGNSKQILTYQFCHNRQLQSEVFGNKS